MTHEEKAGPLVLIGRLAKVLRKISSFVRLVGDYEVCNNCQIEVAVVQERCHPVDEPDAAAVEQDVFRLQVHVARHQIRIEPRVHGTDSFVATKNLLDLSFREQTRRAESPNEELVRGDVVERLGKRRQ